MGVDNFILFIYFFCRLWRRMFLTRTSDVKERFKRYVSLVLYYDYVRKTNNFYTKRGESNITLQCIPEQVFIFLILYNENLVLFVNKLFLSVNAIKTECGIWLNKTYIKNLFRLWAFFEIWRLIRRKIQHIIILVQKTKFSWKIGHLSMNNAMESLVSYIDH